jgi:hypothetical protein
MPNMEMQRARAEIAEAVDAGAPISELEGPMITERPLSREQRDALWLYAWSEVERRQLSRWAREWA